DSVLTMFNESGTSGTASASLVITMKDGTNEQQPRFMKELEKLVSGVEGVKTRVSRASSGGGGGGGGSLRFSVRGPNYDQLAKASSELEIKLRAVPGMQSIKSDINLSAPQATMRLDRTAAARLGVSAREVAQAIGAMTGATNLGKY